jgi:hypothetical protein
MNRREIVTSLRGVRKLMRLRSNWSPGIRNRVINWPFIPLPAQTMGMTSPVSQIPHLVNSPNRALSVAWLTIIFVNRRDLQAACQRIFEIRMSFKSFPVMSKQYIVLSRN